MLDGGGDLEAGFLVQRLADHLQAQRQAVGQRDTGDRAGVERCGVDEVTNNLRINRSGDKAGDKGSMQSAGKSAGKSGDKHAEQSDDEATDASRAGRKGSATTSRAGL